MPVDGCLHEPTVFPSTDEEQAKKNVEIRKPTTGVPAPQVDDKSSDKAKVNDKKQDSKTDPTDVKKTESKSGPDNKPADSENKSDNEKSKTEDDKNNSDSTKKEINATGINLD